MTDQNYLPGEKKASERLAEEIASNTEAQKRAAEVGAALRKSRKSRKPTNDRLYQVLLAMEDERQRFNHAIYEGGKVAILHTAFGDYKVHGVDNEHWYHTVPAEQKTKVYGSERSFCGCNDGTWADLMKQVGEERNWLFREPAKPVVQKES